MKKRLMHIRTPTASALTYLTHGIVDARPTKNQVLDSTNQIATLNTGTLLLVLRLPIDQYILDPFQCIHEHEGRAHEREANTDRTLPSILANIDQELRKNIFSVVRRRYHTETSDPKV
jgi:hypothetical protein